MGIINISKQNISLTTFCDIALIGSSNNNRWNFRAGLPGIADEGSLKLAACGIEYSSVFTDVRLWKLFTDWRVVKGADRKGKVIK